MLLDHKFVLLGQHLSERAVKLVVPPIVVLGGVIVTIVSMIFTSMLTCGSIGSAAEITHASNERLMLVLELLHKILNH